MQRVFSLFAAAVPLLLLADAASPFKPHQLRWWAAQPIKKAASPAADKSLIRNDIDAFVLAQPWETLSSAT